LALAVGLALLLGGFGSAGRDVADPQEDAEAADVRLDAEQGDVAVDRDAEGSISGVTSVADPASADDAGEQQPASTTGAESGPATADGPTDPGSSVTADGATANQTMATDAATGNDATGDGGEANTVTATAEPPPAEPAQPPPPPQDPLRDLPEVFDLAAATTVARQAARDNPLDEKAGQIRIGKVDLAAGQPLNLRLLGGKLAVPGDAEFAVRPVFSLEEDNFWRIDLVEEPGVVIPVGQFTLSDGNLVYQWAEVDHVKSAEQLQNCLIDLWTGEHRHVMPLRSPQPAENVVLEVYQNDFQDSIPVSALPDPGSLRLEVVRLTGTGQPTRLPADPSVWLGESIMIDLLDKNRNAAAALRITCEGAHAGRVRFRVNPMAKTAGRTAATMGIQSATSEISKLRREKESLQQQIRAIDAQLQLLKGQGRELADKAKHARHTRIRAIDQRIGQLNNVLALLKPLHEKAGLQLRVVMNVDGQDVVLAGPPKDK
jgi:hypothetical protein